MDKDIHNMLITMVITIFRIVADEHVHGSMWICGKTCGFVENGFNKRFFNINKQVLNSLSIKKEGLSTSNSHIVDNDEKERNSVLLCG